MPTQSDSPIDPTPASESDLAAWLAAVERGDAIEVSSGISRGFPLEARRLSHHQPTAALLAAASGQPECLAALLAAGADAGARDLHGHGLAYWAVAGGCDRCLSLAIEAGCDIEARGRLGGSAGAQAAMGNPDALRRLLAAGLDALAVDVEGQTLLMLAARFRQLECARLLIEAGVSVNAVSKRGAAAAEQAAKSRSPEIVALLAEAGCDLNRALERVRSEPIHTEHALPPDRELDVRSAWAAAITAQLARREARALDLAVGPRGPGGKRAL